MKIHMALGRLALLAAFLYAIPLAACFPGSSEELVDFVNETDSEIRLRVDVVSDSTELPFVPVGDLVRASTAGCGRAQPGKESTCGVGDSQIRRADDSGNALLVTAFSLEDPIRIIFQKLTTWDQLSSGVLRVTAN